MVATALECLPMKAATSPRAAVYCGRISALSKSNSILISMRCGAMTIGQPSASTLVPFGVFGHLSLSSVTPSPSLSAGAIGTGAALGSGAGGGSVFFEAVLQPARNTARNAALSSAVSNFFINGSLSFLGCYAQRPRTLARPPSRRYIES